MAEVSDVLQTTALFEGISQQEIDRLMEVGRVEYWPNGAMVLEEGTFGPRLMVLLEGTAEVLRRDRDGVQRSLAEIGTGEAMGEMSLLLDHSRTATVRASSDVRAFTMDRVAFKQMIDEGDPAALKLTYNLSKTLAGRLHRLSERVVDLLRQLDEEHDRLDAFGRAREELLTLWDY